MAKSAKKSQLMEICLPNSRNNGKIIMVRNVRAYISNRQEQMQRIVSYISFQRIPGEQPGDPLCSRSCWEYFPDLPVKLFVGIQRQNNRKLKKNM